MKVARRICTFESLHHLRDIDGKLYEKNCELWKSGRDKDDGLTHCDYEIIKTTNHADYYKISVGL
jgi:hypothetical protein